MGALLRIRQVREYLNHPENRYLILAVVAMGALMVFLYSVRITVARDLGQWSDVDPALSAWYRSLRQPDNPAISCCGEADSYFCDETFEGGKAVCVIADDRDDEKLKRPHVDNGTRILIPDHKLKWDQGNPTGRGVVFLSSTGHVWCYVRPGGV
jgi:hypothetical protein